MNSHSLTGLFIRNSVRSSREFALKLSIFVPRIPHSKFALPPIETRSKSRCAVTRRPFLFAALFLQFRESINSNSVLTCKNTTACTHTHTHTHTHTLSSWKKFCAHMFLLSRRQIGTGLQDCRTARVRVFCVAKCLCNCCILCRLLTVRWLLQTFQRRPKGVQEGPMGHLNRLLFFCKTVSHREYIPLIVLTPKDTLFIQIEMRFSLPTTETN